MKNVHLAAWILVIVGGLNWLLVAFGYNLVDSLFGVGSTISMVIYILVGLSAVYELVTHKTNCKNCSASM